MDACSQLLLTSEDMDTQILQPIIEITRQRDLDSLEYSLVATLAELIPVNSISLYKLLKTDRLDDIEEVVHLNIETDEENDKTIYTWNHEPRFIGADQHLEKCLQTSQAVTYKDQKELTNLMLPISCGNNLVGALALTCHQDISSFRTLIEGLIKIYGNYLYILNESERDKLTGLFNRRTFDNKLSRMLKAQHQKKDDYAASNLTDKRYSGTTIDAWLVIMDIDHFKRVNDTYGHLYGDEVILLLSQKMQECFRSSDLLFRFGGEEFVIILEPIPADMANSKLEQFRETISNHEFPQIGQVTISIGYAKISENDFPATILNLADKALYYAKGSGRNCIYNYEALVAEGKLTDLKKSGSVDLF